MKAISYLQKLGAIPQCSVWDLQMAVVVITDEMFNSSTVMEPDCLEWVQSNNDSEDGQDLFSKKCDLILFSTAGDVRALGPTLFSVTDVKMLQELIEELLEVKLMMFGLEHGDEEAFNVNMNDEWFVLNFNELAGLPHSEKFSTKSQILRFYYSGILTEIGESVLEKEAGPPQKFLSVVRKMEEEFHEFAKKEKADIVGGAYENVGGNPFEGEHVRVIEVAFEGEEGYSVGALHWSPWPSISVVESYPYTNKFAELCKKYNAKSRSEWFAGIH